MPTALLVTPWPDPVLDVLGHDPRSWYAETFWLPTLGPTALLLMRHLADRFERSPEGVELKVADTAAALGLGSREGNSSPLVRSLGRLRQFDLATTADEHTISVRRALPPVHRRHVRRLPLPLQAEHEAWMVGQRAAPLELVRRRARRVGRGGGRAPRARRAGLRSIRRAATGAPRGGGARGGGAPAGACAAPRSWSRSRCTRARTDGAGRGSS